VVQYREKRQLSTEARIATARAVVEAVRGLATRVIVNDRADVALACEAWGVHLGEGDLDPAAARRLLGGEAVIGATANELERAVAVAVPAVDYLGVGPVFGTDSKAAPAPTLGLEGLARIVAAVDRPVVAIGNITADRVASVLATGAFGVAVLSAVVCRPDPRQEARRFRQEIDAYRNGKGGRRA
jgi:thiamine-phosphate pyrophosphorylase